MKLSRFAALTSAFFVTSALALTGASAAASAQLPTATGYVALGDSYSSGVGAGSYDSAGGSCKRSAKSYPALWAAAHSPSSFRFTACSGARTGDVLSSQLGPLSNSTGLVSITIGGNDAGFADTMTTCALQGESACLSRVAQARSFIDSTLPGRLDGVYDAISQKAPAARVVVLGYPHFYRLNGTCIAGLSERSRAAINAAADDINGVMAKRAADHGFSFADVNATFSGHELCSGSPWLHSVTFPVDESYHPTAAGQSGGYLPVFASAA
ncbi:SGNH/GDSL hydrolase family protein [Streptomyces kronopolitis]|uniref:Lipase 1 n=1 Tax=Streptomyces kronopolitis TaxID=1612435 RepID=A0ABQ2JNT4_9ACTN|nr:MULTISPECIES: SGNH/GDSL hydrolase family protein [Streptomyces]MCL6300456.1 SGNH/GDSL hydrolase family protein [Streptomyces kronopolitis]GGN51801.1 lipase 1 [Streptomyces kronopolitis]GLW18490.1 lipase 1 [Streptomyces sp. NBRC 13847]